MLKRVYVDVKPASLVCQVTLCNKLGGALRWDNVQKVELLFNDLTIGIAVCKLSDPIVLVDCDKLVFELLLDALAHTLIVESSVVGIAWREHDRRR